RRHDLAGLGLHAGHELSDHPRHRHSLCLYLRGHADRVRPDGDSSADDCARLHPAHALQNKRRPPRGIDGLIMVTTLFISIIILLAIGVPVAFAMAMAAGLAVFVGGQYPLLVVFKEIFSGIDSFPLMAVPFFILAAELMTGGALTTVLLRFAAQFVGHLPGRLGYANIMSLTIFAGLSGSALAEAAGPGAMMTRMMEKAGYDRAYAAALTAGIAIVGPILPPSVIMIIYALQDQAVTVGGLFMAGIVPGLLIAVAMALVNWAVS